MSSTTMPMRSSRAFISPLLLCRGLEIIDGARAAVLNVSDIPMGRMATHGQGHLFHGRVAGRLHRRTSRRDLGGAGRGAPPLPQRAGARVGSALVRAAPVRGDVRLGHLRGGASLGARARARVRADLEGRAEGRVLAHARERRGATRRWRRAMSPTRSPSSRGTPFFPPLEERMELKLEETRSFASGAVYLRYSTGR